MSEKLRNCPFCGEMIREDDYGNKYPVGYGSEFHKTYHLICECCGLTINNYFVRRDLVKYWNTRPIEDALQRRIDELTAELAALREQVRWRKYPDEMPKRDGFYLVLENVNQVAGYYHWCKQFGWNTDRGRINIQSVTHWMPLPQPPEGE